MSNVYKIKSDEISLAPITKSDRDEMIKFLLKTNPLNSNSEELNKIFEVNCSDVENNKMEWIKIIDLESNEIIGDIIFQDWPEKEECNIGISFDSSIPQIIKKMKNAVKLAVGIKANNVKYVIIGVGLADQKEYIEILQSADFVIDSSSNNLARKNSLKLIFKG